MSPILLSGRGNILQDKHHLEERITTQVAIGLEFLDQFLEGQVLVRIRAHGGFPHPASNSRKLGLPDRSVRMTRVLTKKPINFSTSARLRPAIGEPTTTSCWPE